MYVSFQSISHPRQGVNMSDYYDKEKSHLWQVMNHFDIQGKELAAAIGVSPTMISRWFSGAKRLSVGSKSMEKMADYFLNRTLSAEDRVWLIRHFVQAGFPGSYKNISALKTGLINFLANDGSCLEKEDPMKQGISGKEFYTIAGYNDILLNLNHFLDGLKDGSEIWFFTTGGNIESIGDFSNEIVNILERRLRVTLLLTADRDRKDSESLFLEHFAGILIRPGIRAGILRESRIDLAETVWVLIPGVCCMEIFGMGKDAPVVASVICNEAFLKQTLDRMHQIVGQMEPLFCRNMTTRLLETIQENGNKSSREVLVISDGLDPMFMLPGRFEAYLRRRGEAEDTINWKLTQFCHRREEFENNLAAGMIYDEINTGKLTGKDARIRIYGGNLFEETSVDLQTAWDILDGCCQLASKYASFTLRMDRPAPFSFDSGYFRLQDGQFLIRYRDGAGAKYSENEALAAKLRDDFQFIWETVANRRRSDPGSGTLELLRRKMEEIRNNMPSDVSVEK